MNRTTVNLDATKLASSILETRWGDSRFPVDSCVIAAGMGIHVHEAELPENVVSALVKDADKEPVMLLDQSDSEQCRRFSCARKLGLLLELERREANCYKYVEFREQEAEFIKAEEAFAHDFAVCLLVPERAARQLARNGMDLKTMSACFGVSSDVMEYRLRQLQIDLELVVAV